MKEIQFDLYISKNLCKDGHLNIELYDNDKVNVCYLDNKGIKKLIEHLKNIEKEI